MADLAPQERLIVNCSVLLYILLPRILSRNYENCEIKSLVYILKLMLSHLETLGLEVHYLLSWKSYISLHAHKDGVMEIPTDIKNLQISSALPFKTTPGPPFSYMHKLIKSGGVMWQSRRALAGSTNAHLMIPHWHKKLTNTQNYYCRNFQTSLSVNKSRSVKGTTVLTSRLIQQLRRE